MPLRIEIADEQENRPIDEALRSRLKNAVQVIADDYQILKGEISIAILDDVAIRKLNKEFLDHDWATDVITFPLEIGEQELEGEIVVSRETADRVSQEVPWSEDDELLLYVIHGMLHLVGFDDQDDASRLEMKCEEREYLIKFKIPGAESHE